MGSYSWTQTLGEVAVVVPVPPGTKGRACDIAISRDKLRVGLKGQPPVLGEPAGGGPRGGDSCPCTRLKHQHACGCGHAQACVP